MIGNRPCQQTASIIDLVANCITNRRFFVDNRIDVAKAHALEAQALQKLVSNYDH